MSYSDQADLIEGMRQKLDKIDKLKQDNEKRFEAMGQMSEDIKELSATATSGDRTVTVTAGPGGAIESVRLTDEALKSSAIRLSDEITSTVQQAVASAARQQAAIVQDYVGDHTNMLDRVLETQARMFGTSVDALRDRGDTEVATTHRQTEPEPGHDDFSTDTVLTDANQEVTGSAESAEQPVSAGDEFLKNLFDEQEEEN